MDIVPDLAELGCNPLIGPAFKRPPEINTNDLAEYTGIHTFEVISRSRHKKISPQRHREHGDLRLKERTAD
jgi:hypothetical protein